MYVHHKGLFASISLDFHPIVAKYGFLEFITPINFEILIPDNLALCDRFYIPDSSTDNRGAKLKICDMVSEEKKSA